MIKQVVNQYQLGNFIQIKWVYSVKHYYVYVLELQNMNKIFKQIPTILSVDRHAQVLIQHQRRSFTEWEAIIQANAYVGQGGRVESILERVDSMS